MSVPYQAFARHDPTVTTTVSQGTMQSGGETVLANVGEAHTLWSWSARPSPEGRPEVPKASKSDKLDGDVEQHAFSGHLQLTS